MSATNQPTGGRTPPPVTHIRLSEEQVRALEKSLPPCVVNGQTTDIQAGEIIGVQRVLNALRRGWVV